MSAAKCGESSDINTRIRRLKHTRLNAIAILSMLKVRICFCGTYLDLVGVALLPGSHAEPTCNFHTLSVLLSLGCSMSRECM